MEDAYENMHVAKMITSKLEQSSKKCNSIEDYLTLAYEFSFENYSIKPFQLRNEILDLLKILGKEKPHALLEIGTANGGTLFLLSKVASSNAIILSIDLPNGPFGGDYYPEWKKPLYESFASKRQQIHLIREDSHNLSTFEEIKKIIGEKKLDFILIDGDHTYEGVKKDFEMYCHLINEEGIIAFHDINPGPKDNVGEVPKFWNEISSKYLSLEIIDNNEFNGYGIGLLFYNLKNERSPKYVEALKISNELKNKKIINLQNTFISLESKMENIPIGSLISIYAKRLDLQKAYPEVFQGNYVNLISWALAVCNDTIKETEVKSKLSKFISQFNEYLSRIKDSEKLLESTNTAKIYKDYFERILKEIEIQKQALDINKTNLQKVIDEIRLEKERLISEKGNLQKVIDETRQERQELVIHLEALKIQTQSNLEIKDNQISKMSNEIQQLKGEIVQLSPPPYGPLETLIEIWSVRQDLKTKFHEVSSGNLRNLIKWASGVVLQHYGDTAYDTLKHHSAWYVHQSHRPQPHVFKEGSSLMEYKKIAIATHDIIKREGFKSYLKHVREKIKKREFKLTNNFTINNLVQHKDVTTAQNPFTKQKIIQTIHDNNQLSNNLSNESKEHFERLIRTEKISDELRSKHLDTILSIYKQRLDLQKSYPEVAKGDYSNFFGWITSVCNGHIKGEQYVKQMMNDFVIWYVNNFGQIDGIDNFAPVSYFKKQSGMDKFINENIILNFEHKPKISIIMPVYNVKKIWLERALDSVLEQQYRNWELCIADDASTDSHIGEVLEHYSSLDSRIKVTYLKENKKISGATNEALKFATGEFVAFLDDDDELTPDALFEIVRLLNLQKDVDVIYSDDAKKDENDNIYDPQFKPDWSPELLLSYSYLSHLFVARKKIVDELGGFRTKFDSSSDYDLMLRVTEKTDKIYHVPKILYYWRSIPTSSAFSVATKPKSIENGRMAVQDAIDRRGISANAVVPEYAKDKNGVYKLNFHLKRFPKVSIIIPTKDKLELLKNCIDSIEHKITYKNFEIIIVDTGSKDQKAVEYLQNIKHKVIRLDSNKFNFSKINNFAVKEAGGEYVLLLNNDTEIISPNMLEEMIGYLELDSKIAVVGAKLFYKDKKVQHGGVILGINGISGHANKLLEDWNPGYLMYAHVARNYSAVTAACMMVSKKVYEEVGGLDEENLPVAYNDVDFCLKVLDKGYRIVYNPYAAAYHYEGLTRGTGKGNDDPKEENYLKMKWYDKINRDPYYNPNLSQEDEKFGIKKLPSNMKRILFVSHNMNFEGAPLSLSYLAKGMKKRGYAVTVISLKDGPLKVDFMKNYIDVIIRDDFYKISQQSKDFIRNFDYVYINTILNYPFVELSLSAGVPVVWCIRESERDHYLKEGVDFDQFKKANLVEFVANATRKIYSDLDYRGNQITIPNGIMIDQIESFKLRNSRDELRRKHGFTNNDFIILIIGTVTERKGQLIFVQAALEMLKKNNNPKLQFVIVGCRQSKYLDNIKKIIDDAKISSQIRLIPETGEVFDYYSISDMFVCASFIESFPRVTLEAMAFQIPIIATNVFGIPEQIENEKSGELIAPGDSKLLAAKIQFLLDNPDLAMMYAKNAFEKVKKEFDMERIISQHEEVFKSLSKNMIVTTIRKNN